MLEPEIRQREEYHSPIIVYAYHQQATHLITHNFHLETFRFRAYGHLLWGLLHLSWITSSGLLQFRNSFWSYEALRHFVRISWRWIDLSQYLNLHRTTLTQNIGTNPCPECNRTHDLSIRGVEDNKFQNTGPWDEVPCVSQLISQPVGTAGLFYNIAEILPYQLSPTDDSYQNS